MQRVRNFPDSQQSLSSHLSPAGTSPWPFPLTLRGVGEPLVQALKVFGSSQTPEGSPGCIWAFLRRDWKRPSPKMFLLTQQARWALCVWLPEDVTTGCHHWECSSSRFCLLGCKLSSLILLPGLECWLRGGWRALGLAVLPQWDFFGAVPPKKGL